MKTKPPASEEKSTVRTYDLVLEYLKGQILEGKLTLGAKLPSERSLMAELGLSRNSVREALRQLENMGFVRSVHGQGSFLVNEAGQGFSSILSMMLLLRQSDRGEFLTLRESLEGAAYERAVRLAPPQPIQAMEQAVQAMEQAVQAMEQAQEPGQLEEAESRFHRSLIEAGENQLIAAIMEALSSQGDLYRRETLAQLDEATRTPLLDTHRRILKALQTGDAPLGRAALAEHFRLIQ
ncbi:FadR/GntR family transcriptional regulator [uncultured Allofournierella sp.]|uniref:FadR/GntR family transcriptional regulator n=1 Tax=uncultured Allofournierella sp. TaxID=1940258 RepID=UPI0025EB47E9|nr:FCD domain-containing protein [uncultured Fournierella sp.]